MTLSCGPYANEADLWRIRAFLREVFLLNSRHECSWQVYRFDYWLRHVNANLEKMPLEEVAAFATVWFDDVTRTGSFEPVGTVPAHQRRGLGKALMLEGLHRLKALGATLATVGSYTEAAGALYASAGFTEYDLSEPWCKEFHSSG